MAKIKLHPVVIFLLGVLVGAILVAVVYKVGVPGQNVENTILRSNIIIPSGVTEPTNDIIIPSGTENIIIPSGIESDVQTSPIIIPSGIK